MAALLWSEKILTANPVSVISAQDVYKRQAQQRKLDKSGLIRLFDGVFISEQVGAEKPSPDFFRAVFNHVGPIAPEEVLIVGDSLTSDIQGGNNAGILCCWYDPEDRPLPQGLTVHYHIQDLNQVREILTLSL